MTKTETADLATAQAELVFDSIRAVGTEAELAGLIKALHENIAHEGASRGSVRLQTLREGGRMGIHAPTFMEQFAKCFATRVRTAYNQLPDVKAEHRLQSFTWVLESMERSGREDLDRFTKRFAENPAYAFEWSSAAFEAAAKLDVVAKVRGMMAQGATLDVVQKELLEEVVRGARHPHHSTSSQSNEMATLKLAAMAELVQR